MSPCGSEGKTPGLLGPAHIEGAGRQAALLLWPGEEAALQRGDLGPQKGATKDTTGQLPNQYQETREMDEITPTEHIR